LSVPEPEIPKPDKSVVETPPPNLLGDLEAQNKALMGELDTARQRLAVVERQIADSAADRTDDEPLRQQLKQTQEQLEEVTRDRDELQADLERTRAELAKLKDNPPPAIEQNPAPAIDLPEQVGEIVNFLKESLPPDTKWPKRIIPALRKFLEAKED
jgi:septal ring factor EnvC (AmiA/AmiB activator)